MLSPGPLARSDLLRPARPPFERAVLVPAAVWLAGRLYPRRRSGLQRSSFDGRGPRLRQPTGPETAVLARKDVPVILCCRILKLSPQRLRGLGVRLECTRLCLVLIQRLMNRGLED